MRHLLLCALAILPSVSFANPDFIKYCQNPANAAAKTSLDSLRLVSARSSCEKIAQWLEKEESCIFSRLDLPNLDFLKFFQVKELRLRQTTTTDFSALKTQGILKHLVLEGIHLNAKDIHMIESLAGLTHLEISGSDLKKIEFKHHRLVELDLSDNSLTEVHLETPMLEILDLSRNKIAKMDGLPPNLLHLEIAGNEFKILPSPMPKMQVLVANDNHLENVNAILQAKDLREVYASGNQLSELPNLSSLRELRVLAIADNQLHDPNFGTPPQLKTVHLN